MGLGGLWKPKKPEAWKNVGKIPGVQPRTSDAYRTKFGKLYKAGAFNFQLRE